MNKLSTVIDTQFIPHDQTKIGYEGYLNENGFKIRDKTMAYGISGVVIYGKLEESRTKEITIKVKMRLSYIAYGGFFVFVGVFLKGFVVRLVNSSGDWLEALLMAAFTWLTIVAYYWFNVREFKRTFNKVFSVFKE